MARLIFYWSSQRIGVEAVGTLALSSVLTRTPKKARRTLRQTIGDGHDLNYFLLHHLGTLDEALHERDRRLTRKRDAEAATPAPANINHRQRAILHCASKRPDTVFTIAAHQEAQGIVYETARTDLANLTERGLLSREKAGRTFVYRTVSRGKRR